MEENKKPLIMVVEDEMLLLQAISKKLKIEGIETISCSSGHQAIDYLGSIEEMPDAIWLDYYLGDMNGLEFVEELKKNDKWKEIMVVVVSNSTNPQKVFNMLALGVRKYLLKAEYRLDDIIKIVINLYQNKGKSNEEDLSSRG